MNAKVSKQNHTEEESRWDFHERTRSTVLNRSLLIGRVVLQDPRINGLDYESMDVKLMSGIAKLEKARKEIVDPEHFGDIMKWARGERV